MYNTNLDIKRSKYNLVPKVDNYSRTELQPSIKIGTENVFYSKSVYDFRLKRLTKI